MTSALSRTLWLIVGGAVLLTAVFLFLGGRRSTARVAVADVLRDNLSSVVSTNGKVEPVSPLTFRARYPTFVTRVSAVEGQQVKRGQELFTLDDTEIQAELAQDRADLATQQEALKVARAGGVASQAARAAADLQKAEASRDQLKRDNETLTKLLAEKAATLQELDQNRLQLIQAEADVRSAEKVKQTLDQQAQLDQSRVSLLVDHARETVRDLEEKARSAHGIAAVDGTLYSLPIHQGDFVKAGDLLAEMADLHKVRIRAFIDEPDLGQVAVGQNVETLWDAHPDRVWNGETEILPKQVVTRGTRNVGELLCSVTNDRLDLLPNTTVDVRIQVTERTGTLVVPRGAIFIEGDKRYVYRVVNDRIYRQMIKVGIANPTKIEVLSGLHQGDVVALPGEVTLKENLRIIPVRQE
ncbi:MAG TPA: efflux RND transporter periplasmic adaptor subunit [Verrucomicrobiae bacterium]|jgi:HlyD family secretion protein|nr:efflux RND transporter periplasmic adaptor subunit [Verrucomicrobiae bacterium]